MPGDELAETIAALTRGNHPGFELAPMGMYTVEKIEGQRLAVRAVERDEKLPDMAVVEVWPGIPGAESTPTVGELLVVAFVGDKRYPTIIGRAPPGTPAARPAELAIHVLQTLLLRCTGTIRMNAATEIRMLDELPLTLTAKVRVGSGGLGPPEGIRPVALADTIVNYLVALEIWAKLVDMIVAVPIAALPSPLPATYLAAVAARATAAGAMPPDLTNPANPLNSVNFVTLIPSTKLEAK